MSLGTYRLDPSASHRVELTDDANGEVVADAVHIVSKAGPNLATWTLPIATSGSYEVYTRWTECPDHLSPWRSRALSNHDVYTKIESYTSWRAAMRTNIIIDDQLLSDAQRITGIKTKKGVVEEGLKVLLRLQRQQAVKKYRGKLRWTGNLDAMRRDATS